MLLPDWWKNRLKTDFTPRGLFVRVAVDLFLSNFGLLLGVVTTVGLKVFQWDALSKAFFYEMFLKVWLPNVPIVTLFCLVAYSFAGLYRGTRNEPYVGRLILVGKSVGFAFLLFISWVYIRDVFVPKSTMIAGWFYIFIFVLASRLLSTAFFRQYQVTSLENYGSSDG
jgi:FlaA1/EpsC-like NDP-sugar epimerase